MGYVLIPSKGWVSILHEHELSVERDTTSMLLPSRWKPWLPCGGIPRGTKSRMSSLAFLSYYLSAEIYTACMPNHEISIHELPDLLLVPRRITSNLKAELAYCRFHTVCKPWTLVPSSQSGWINRARPQHFLPLNTPPSLACMYILSLFCYASLLEKACIVAVTLLSSGVITARYTCSTQKCIVSTATARVCYMENIYSIDICISLKGQTPTS